MADAVRRTGRCLIVCGIAGVIGRPDEGEAARMIAALAHRGPDGLRVETMGDSVLAHARLSIIDLQGGWQPLHAAGSTVIGNGEIYNYPELIETFGLRGALKTQSDFEPLLHLYAREGEAAFRRLRGMYAFCLVGGDGRTWLVRDAFGIKPLYVRGAGFASEPAALGPVRLPTAAAEELLALNYVLTAPGRLAPGTQAFVPLDAGPHGLGDGDATPPREGSGEAFHTLAAPARAPPPLPALVEVRRFPHGGERALSALDAVLEDSVRVHQRCDVPYGLFLSGGVDSTVIATLMARLNSRPVTAFTCGFDAPGAPDERGQAQAVARALDLDWRETTFGAEDFWRIAPQVASALDDPTTDAACLPTYKLAEAARGTLTVVLTGEGGDELFAGYGRYRRALRPRWLGGRAAEPQVGAPFLKDGGAGALARWRKAVTDSAAPPGLTRLQHAQWGDIATWLPNDLLLKLDRMLMAHGLEGRTPFLDQEVAAFAWSLPDAMKVRGRRGKWILRRWLARHCPAARPWARKRGFTTPVAAWIAPRAADLGPRVAACPGVAEVCDLDAVRAAFADPRAGEHWWPLAFYALWWTIHVGGAAPGEAAETVLGRP